MRRGMRHAHKLGSAGAVDVPPGAEPGADDGAAYPELIRAEAFITETLKLEETRFRQTLERGLKLLDEELYPSAAGKPWPATWRSAFMIPTAFLGFNPRHSARTKPCG